MPVLHLWAAASWVRKPAAATQGCDERVALLYTIIHDLPIATGNALMLVGVALILPAVALAGRLA